MAWAIWVRGLRGPVIQKVFDGVGDKPFINEGIRNSVVASHRLKTDEDELSLEDLASRYPAPNGESAS